MDYDPALRLEGVIMNRVGGDAHTQWLREAVEESGVATRVLGGIPQARCAPLFLTVLWKPVRALLVACCVCEAWRCEHALLRYAASASVRQCSCGRMSKACLYMQILGRLVTGWGPGIV